MNEHAKKLENLAIDMISVPTSWLPESYRGKSETRKLRSVVNECNRRSKVQKDERATPARVNDDHVITYGSPVRLAVLDKYAADVEAGRDIDYDCDNDRLYRNQAAFCDAMGLLED